MKTKPIHFLVTKMKATASGYTIGWKSALTKIGSAMNADPGIFTALVNGVYHFALT